MKLFTSVFFALLLIPAWSANAFYIGIGAHPEGFSGTTNDFINLLHKYEINAIRLDYKWSDVEREKGIYMPPKNKTEKILIMARDNGIEPIVILDYGNKFYGNKKPTTDIEIEAFTKYAVWAVEHFKGKVRIFEIWNEWSNRKDFGANSNESAEQYVKLVSTVSRAIKKKNPDSIVIAGSINPMDYIDLAWAKKLIKLGILDYIDGLSIHPYIYGSKRSAIANKNVAFLDNINQQFMSLSGRSEFINFYITEIGFPTSNKFNTFSQDDVALYAHDYILEASKRYYIKGVWWYDLINDGNSDSNREYNFGILNRDLSEKKVSHAIKAVSNKVKNFD